MEMKEKRGEWDSILLFKSKQHPRFHKCVVQSHDATQVKTPLPKPEIQNEHIVIKNNEVNQVKD